MGDNSEQPKIRPTSQKHQTHSNLRSTICLKEAGVTKPKPEYSRLLDYKYVGYTRCLPRQYWQAARVTYCAFYVLMNLFQLFVVNLIIALAE